MLKKTKKTMQKRQVKYVLKVFFSIAWIFIICYPAPADALDSSLELRITGLTRIDRVAGAETLLQEVAGEAQVVLVRLHLEPEPEWCEAVWSISGDEEVLTRLHAEFQQHITQSGPSGPVQVTLWDEVSGRLLPQNYAGNSPYRQQLNLGFE
jgi:hypothetical protein